MAGTNNLQAEEGAEFLPHTVAAHRIEAVVGHHTEAAAAHTAAVRTVAAVVARMAAVAVGHTVAVEGAARIAETAVHTAHTEVGQAGVGKDFAPVGGKTPDGQALVEVGTCSASPGLGEVDRAIEPAQVRASRSSGL